MIRPLPHELEVKLRRATLAVRRKLTDDFDIRPGAEHENFWGLCNVAYDYMLNELEEENIPYAAHTIHHGELRHNPNSLSENWPHEHTWLSVRFGGVGSGSIYKRPIVVYVDPTCQQFRGIVDDIPDYYISITPPKWFYPDDKNLLYSRLGNKINKCIRIPAGYHAGEGMYCDGIIEFLQYCVWGTISDMLRRIKRFIVYGTFRKG